MPPSVRSVCGWLTNTFMPKFVSTWLAAAAAVAFAGWLEVPMCRPSWSMDAGWPPTVRPETTVPPLDDDVDPPVVAVAVLVSDLILTAPPAMLTSCTTLLARAFTELPLRVLELSEWRFPYVAAPGWFTPCTSAKAWTSLPSAWDVSVVPGIWLYAASGVEPARASALIGYWSAGDTVFTASVTASGRATGPIVLGSATRTRLPALPPYAPGQAMVDRA